MPRAAEFFFPYDNSYDLETEGRHFFPKKHEISQITKLYRSLVPKALRRPLYFFREGLHNKFPTNITVIFKGSPLIFEVGNVQDEVRVKSFGFEENYITRCLSVLKQDDILWDIGANIGTWVLPLAVKQPLCDYVCFEPKANSRDNLIKNIQLNSFNSDQLQVLPYAISDRQGEEKFFNFCDRNKWSSLRNVYGDGSEEIIQTHSIDSLIKERVQRPPSVIKIDVEGAEGLIINGMSPENAPRELFVELHPPFLINNYDTTPSQVWNNIISKGFSPKTVWLRSSALLCHFSKI